MLTGDNLLVHLEVRETPTQLISEAERWYRAAGATFINFQETKLEMREIDIRLVDAYQHMAEVALKLAAAKKITEI